MAAADTEPIRILSLGMFDASLVCILLANMLMLKLP